jgi:hypothetical protein
LLLLELLFLTFSLQVTFAFISLLVLLCRSYLLLLLLELLLPSIACL